MAGALTLERVRTDIAVLSRAGLDTATFVHEAQESLARAIPNRGSCFALVDPATLLLTGTYKFGELHGNDDHDHLWSEIEYGHSEDSSFVPLATRAFPAAAVVEETGGDLQRSTRMRELITPHFGYSDELRMVARSGRQTWGGIALFRSPGDPDFSPTEVEFVASLSPAIGVGMRAGLLARIGATASSASLGGPAVVVVGPDNAVKQMSVGAERVLVEMASDENMSDASGVVGALVAGARAYAAGLRQDLPSSRLRLPSGQWLLLHSSPLTGPGSGTDVVITMEEARPPEIVPLVVAAFDLTARERDVAQLVMQGVDTKEIAASLHMSRYTVQDHLKSIFEKAGVRSRRELLARVFFDQYAPRIGGELAPSGWFET